jgi:opacity protein-like surface antigen
MKKIAAIALSALMLAGTALAAEVDQRQENQQDRINQGVASGELTKKEAHQVERQHKAIGKEIKADRAANGGKLTKGEKREINRQQNRESRKIHRKKHNAAVAK